MVELTWEGKHDADGKRTAPLRLQLPFQTVEMVNESAQERQMALDLFSAGSTGPSTTPLVSLILGLKDPELWHLSWTTSPWSSGPRTKGKGLRTPCRPGSGHGLEQLFYEPGAHCGADLGRLYL